VNTVEVLTRCSWLAFFGVGIRQVLQMTFRQLFVLCKTGFPFLLLRGIDDELLGSDVTTGVCPYTGNDFASIFIQDGIAIGIGAYYSLLKSINN